MREETKIVKKIGIAIVRGSKKRRGEESEKKSEEDREKGKDS